MELAAIEEQEAKKFPQVKFLLNEELDILKITNFLIRTSGGGNNFQENILKEHPQLAGLEQLPHSEREARVGEYVKEYYQKHNDYLKNIPSLAENRWTNYAPTFFKTADKIFKGLSWPPGKYEGYPTIAAPCPRFLDSTTFQIPANQETFIRIKVTAHEMLHFIFFEYVRQKYTPQLPNINEREITHLLDGKFIMPLWNLSEVFDTAVLNDKDFGEGGTDILKPYPDLLDQLSTCKQIWQEADCDIDNFFSKIEIK